MEAAFGVGRGGVLFDLRQPASLAVSSALACSAHTSVFAGR
jgi:hypothetical protein